MDEAHRGAMPSSFWKTKILMMNWIILIYVFLRLFFFYFTLQYCIGFCHTSTLIRHGCTWVPNPEPPSHLPPHTISLGHHHAPAPSMLYPASDIDWRFDSYMIVSISILVCLTLTFSFSCSNPSPIATSQDPLSFHPSILS